MGYTSHISPPALPGRLLLGDHQQEFTVLSPQMLFEKLPVGQEERGEGVKSQGSYPFRLGNWNQSVGFSCGLLGTGEEGGLGLYLAVFRGDYWLSGVLGTIWGAGD